MKWIALSLVLSMTAPCLAEKIEHGVPKDAVLKDGSIIGESDVLTFLRDFEPKLFERIAGFGPRKGRHIFAHLYLRFKDVNTFDKAQKAALVKAFWSHPATTGQKRELPAGSRMDDGTVVGEKEALEYLRQRRPELHERLTAVPDLERREEFGKMFVWFQRVGNYRKRQKAQMLTQIEMLLDAKDLASRYAAANDKKEIKKAIRKKLSGLYGSELDILDMQIGNMEYHLKELQEEVARMKKKVGARRKKQKDLIEERMKKLLSQAG